MPQGRGQQPVEAVDFRKNGGETEGLGSMLSGAEQGGFWEEFAVPGVRWGVAGRYCLSF